MSYITIQPKYYEYEISASSADDIDEGKVEISCKDKTLTGWRHKAVFNNITEKHWEQLYEEVRHDDYFDDNKPRGWR